jgi:hypothetical protein|nr:MAG TPA: hypothetical protein [Caudoviricetes sp.]
MAINSFAGLQAQVAIKLEQAIDLTMKHFEQELYNCIQSEVYSYDQEWYIRTNELLDNWEIVTTKSKNSVESELSFSKSISHSGSPLFQHGFEFINGGNTFLSNQSLLEIIEDGKIGAIANFPQIGSRPFWSEFWKIVDRDLNKVFIQNCQSVGLPIQQGQFSYS